MWNSDENVTAGQLLWTATTLKRQQLLGWLTNALVARDMVSTAATAACAAVDRGCAGDVAAALAPGMVGAVAAGRVAAVARVGHMVVALGYVELLVQIALALLREGHHDTLGALGEGKRSISVCVFDAPQKPRIFGSTAAYARRFCNH